MWPIPRNGWETQHKNVFWHPTVVKWHSWGNLFPEGFLLRWTHDSKKGVLGNFEVVCWWFLCNVLGFSTVALWQVEGQHLLLAYVHTSCLFLLHNFYFLDCYSFHFRSLKNKPEQTLKRKRKEKKLQQCQLLTRLAVNPEDRLPHGRAQWWHGFGRVSRLDLVLFLSLYTLHLQSAISMD